ncbi:TIGR03013 family XrtA/PEP-CTERM system glycosyltransferase [Noviherbaspirillum humi]|uniref:TIGR03013 family XrtA/PEP-CTERM system glycosyltransferase n=1 Tax=Noviherbaspirillum humi TaxID=1688639 RepID=UPI001FE55830|nr:TIGR03013 family XrtA/PEP-CTERM system glycosyltransferase [Noviherbaspirillum humi]
MLIEIVILVTSVYLGLNVRFIDSLRSPINEFPDLWLSSIVFAGVIVFSMSALGMYQLQFNSRFRTILIRLMPSLALGFGLITVAFYVLPALYFGRGVLGLVFLFSALGILCVRIAFLKTSQFNLFESRVLFFGAGELAKECADLVGSGRTNHKYQIVGFVEAPNDQTCLPAKSVLPSTEALLATARRHKATEIVVSVKNRRGGGIPIKELLDCKLHGVHVTDSATFFEREACQIRVDSLQPSWLVFGNGFDQSFMRAFCKRTFDLVVSLLIAFISLPVMVLTAVLIYVEDKGPIFYKQERVGKGGKTYFVLKFRSMRNNAEAAGSPQWASKKDPRTTRIGAIIRVLRIDELPQILNVVKGEMSFVGPRPERPYFVEQLCQQIPFYDVRHSIKPGITGMAQVRYPYGASVQDAIQKLQYDLYYVKNNSLFLDMLILIDTVQVVLLGKGAR